MKKKRNQHTIIASVFVLCAALVFGGSAILDTLRHSTAIIADSQITLDGDFSDWPAGSRIVDESTDMDVTAQEWCWDGAAWQTIMSQDECDTYVYNDAGQFDMQQVYFGVNKENMFFGVQNAFPFFSVKNMQDGSYSSLSSFKGDHPDMVLPQDIDHQIVFAFGPKEREVYDNYMVVHFEMDKEMSLQLSRDEEDRDPYAPTISVYKEANGTVGYNEGQETLMGQLKAGGAEDGTKNTSDSNGIHSTSFEARQPMRGLFNYTGMDYLAYGFRMETHSPSSESDVTKRVIVNLGADAKPSILRPFLLKRTDIKFSNLRKTSALVQWKKTENATSYNVRLEQYNNGKWSQVKVYTNVKTVKKQITAGTLKKDTMYRFQVSACNAGGCSAYSPYQVFKTPKK